MGLGIPDLGRPQSREHRKCESGHSRKGVDDGSSGVIDDGEVGRKVSAAPDAVAGGNVHQKGPEDREDRDGLEPDAFRTGSDDDGSGDECLQSWR